ncbi:DUF29 domain-containing protein [Massilia horti]|nr:DUF29 domain-containing protein [Massilia horti]
MNHLEHGFASLANGETKLPGYDQDFDLWLRAQATLLRERKFDLLDFDNLAEEVEGMARAEHRELRNRLEVVLIHLLKLRFQPGHPSNNWLGTLGEQRSRLGLLIEDSPSMARHIAGYAEHAYRNAVKKAAQETGLPSSTFPATNPFTEAQLLDPDHIP